MRPQQQIDYLMVGTWTVIALTAVLEVGGIAYVITWMVR